MHCERKDLNRVQIVLDNQTLILHIIIFFFFLFPAHYQRNCYGLVFHFTIFARVLT